MSTAAAVPKASSLLDEHRALRAVVTGLKRTLGQLPAPSEEGDWWESLSYRLRMLRVLLRGHFAAEESAGVFDRMRAQAPEHSTACDRFLQEHVSLLVRLDDLAEEASLRVGASRWATSMRDLLDDLASHEEREDELLFRTLDATPGAPD